MLWITVLIVTGFIVFILTQSSGTEQPAKTTKSYAKEDVPIKPRQPDPVETIYDQSEHQSIARFCYAIDYIRKRYIYYYESDSQNGLFCLTYNGDTFSINAFYNHEHNVRDIIEQSECLEYMGFTVAFKGYGFNYNLTDIPIVQGNKCCLEKLCESLVTNLRNSDPNVRFERIEHGNGEESLLVCFKYH